MADGVGNPLSRHVKGLRRLTAHKASIGFQELFGRVSNRIKPPIGGTVRRPETENPIGPAKVDGAGFAASGGFDAVSDYRTRSSHANPH